MSELIDRLRERANDDDRALYPATRALLREAADALEAARVDAARYRWLRDSCDASAACVLCMRREADEWDTAIDAAMADAARGDGGGDA